MTPVLLIVFVILIFIGFEAHKAYWDGKVDELCDIEGGVKVFHPTPLPGQEYDKLLDKRGQIRIRHQRFAHSNDAYVYTTHSELIDRRFGGLRIEKFTYQILKMPEKLVLSEKSSFSRVAGDFFPIDHSSSHTCPRESESLTDMTFSRLPEAGR